MVPGASESPRASESLDGPPLPALCSGVRLQHSLKLPTPSWLPLLLSEARDAQECFRGSWKEAIQLHQAQVRCLEHQSASTLSPPHGARGSHTNTDPGHSFSAEPDCLPSESRGPEHTPPSARLSKSRWLWPFLSPGLLCSLDSAHPQLLGFAHVHRCCLHSQGSDRAKPKACISERDGTGVTTMATPTLTWHTGAWHTRNPPERPRGSCHKAVLDTRRVTFREISQAGGQAVNPGQWCATGSEGPFPEMQSQATVVPLALSPISCDSHDDFGDHKLQMTLAVGGRGHRRHTTVGSRLSRGPGAALQDAVEETGEWPAAL
nr:uncharacterized protein LOC114105308 isoform X2 [Marmota flaviventris]